MFQFYEKTRKCSLTIPRAIIEAGNLNWDHKDDIGIIIKAIDGKQGLFLWKREKEKSTPQKKRAQVIELDGTI